MTIGGDNDATLRIATDAASAKRALHIRRRLGHVRQLTIAKKIKGVKVKRDHNISDVGTHYVVKEILTRFRRHLRGAQW